MELIDTHAHLFSTEFSGDISEIISRAKEASVTKIYLPNIDLESMGSLKELVTLDNGLFVPLMGLHPSSVTADYSNTLAIIKQELFTNSEYYKGIGETGTDHYWDKSLVKEQEESFRMQIEWAIELKKPIIIHSRETLALNIGIIEEYKKDHAELRGIFHCFNDSESEAMQIREMGFLIGIGGVLTFKNAGVDISLKQVPLDCMVLETDAPYLAPVPYRGKRNETSYLRIIADKLAEVKETTVLEVAKITSENARMLFGS